MSAVKIGVIGRIVGGYSEDSIGWYVLIQPDPESPSQYFLYESPNVDFTGHGFDTYFTSLEEVENHLKYYKYKIEWFNGTTNIHKMI